MFCPFERAVGWLVVLGLASVSLPACAYSHSRSRYFCLTVVVVVVVAACVALGCVVLPQRETRQQPASSGSDKAAPHSGDSHIQRGESVSLSFSALLLVSDIQPTVASVGSSVLSPHPNGRLFLLLQTADATCE